MEPETGLDPTCATELKYVVRTLWQCKHRAITTPIVSFMFVSIPRSVMNIGSAHRPAGWDPEVSFLAQRYNSVMSGHETKALTTKLLRLPKITDQVPKLLTLTSWLSRCGFSHLKSFLDIHARQKFDDKWKQWIHSKRAADALLYWGIPSVGMPASCWPPVIHFPPIKSLLMATFQLQGPKTMWANVELDAIK